VEINKRTSHGRGEYEIAGSVDGLSTGSLIGKSLVIETRSRFGLLTTGIVLRTQGGKPRLRRASNSGIHIQRQIEALLLMPKSIRGEGQLVGGQPIVIADRYVLRRVEVTSAAVYDDNVLIQLGGIDCINDSGTEQIDFPDRVQNILHLYEHADELPSAIAVALKAHGDYIIANHSVTARTEALVAQVISATAEVAEDSDTPLLAGEDPVPLLLDLLSSKPSVEIPSVDQIDPTDIEFRRRVADRWRLQKDRGPTANKFRREVRKAYDSTCLFCGLRLPTSDRVRVPGVDAAHIVPWSAYEADVVGNGLCLCKLHHWAFDQYLLALKYDPVNGYSIAVTETAQQAFADAQNTLDSLNAVSGAIALSRLPSNPDDWPKPEMLKKLYEDMGIDL
jgi:hypothetical protein